ncbi:MAG: DNA-processing protein DprA [Syntrophobacterales bacterium]|nr:MAG: DNA-processing protein DprA [Syntrophobacterales bacterium]
MDERFYWLALNIIPGIGPILIKALIERFGNPKRVFKASRRELARVDGIGERLAYAIKDTDVRGKVERELRLIEELNASIVTLIDQSYPDNLKQIYDPPPLLYVRGDLQPKDKLAISMVGSRLASNYGRMITERIAGDLARLGVTIVSGMARGIDSAAHRGALSVGGRTIAVLGCGVDIVYPRENRHLFEEITAHGAVISEFPLSTPPEGANFPKRNRIISGLSLGVVIVQATSTSGSLITAGLALEQNRDVFAVPGNVGMAGSRGTNRLIKQGAKLIETAEDILEDVLPRFQHQELESEDRDLPLGEEEERVFCLFEDEPIHIDSIIAQTRMSASRVSTILLQLELKGLVQQLSGKRFVKR